MAVSALFMIGTASCQKEGVIPTENDPVAVFEVTMPGHVQTRTIGDGKSASELLYGIYAMEKDKDGNITSITYIKDGKGVKTSDLKFRVEERLVRNVDYRIVFWAQAPGNKAYAVDFAAATVTADYTQAANDETRDAFYNYQDVRLEKPADAFDVKLYRPLAQINFGSTAEDFEAIKYFLVENEMTSTIEFAEAVVPNVFSLTEGKITESCATVSFAAAAAPCGKGDGEMLELTDGNYAYVGVNYIFAGEKDMMTSPMNASFTHDKGTITLSIKNLPYQANYRTNILGNLFTEQAVVNITVEPIPVGNHNEAYPQPENNGGNENENTNGTENE